MTTVKKHPFPDRSDTSGTASKPPQNQTSNSSSNTGSNKPNAWSKPLPGSHPNKKGAAPSGTSSTNTTSTRSTIHSSSSSTGSKAPPGLAKPHHHNQTDKNSTGTSVTLNAMRERYLHLLLTLVGHKVTVVMKSKVQYTGVLHTATPFSHLPEAHRHKYVLKAVIVEGATDSDSAASPVKPGQTVLLDMDAVEQLHVKSCRLDALVGSTKNSGGGGGSTSTFDAFTDTEISGAMNTSRNRNSRGSNDIIQADATWTSGNDTGPLPLNSRASKMTGGSVSSSGSAGTGPLTGSIAGWDQFKANEELFNVVGSYDESVYTTKLDRAKFSATDRHRAEQLAREIEGTSSSNMHIAEERGHILSQDYDEEDRYSGVLKVNTTTKPKLNYAQAVTKTSDTVVPPGFDGELESASVKPELESSAATVEPESAPKAEHPAETVLEKKPDEKASPPENVEDEEEREASVFETNLTTSETPKVPATTVESDTPAAAETPTPNEPKSKLSASAKSFSFNINAKTFTPTPPPPPPPPPPLPLPPPQFIDPVTGIPMMMTMGAPMIPEGMMPIMMNPGQYPGIRYAGHYPGVEHLPHPMAHMQHQMQQVPHPPAAPVVINSEEPLPAPVSDEGSVAVLPQPQEGDGSFAETSPHAPQQPPPPPPPPPPPIQHHIPVQPHMYFPNNYYPPPMGMVPQHHPQHFMHPQMAAHMQRHMYPMPAGMPPNMMRSPPSYFPTPNGPMPYPPTYGGGVYNTDEDPMNYGGRGGRGGRGRGTVGRAARGQGRGGPGGRVISGRGRFNHQYSGVSNSSHGDSGRDTPSDPSPSLELPPPTAITPTPFVPEGPTPDTPNDVPMPNAAEPSSAATESSTIEATPQT